MFDVQVCLVSQQAAPNLLPLLDPVTKPKEVVLLVSDEMKRSAQRLEEVIKPTGIKIRHEHFSALGDFQEMQSQLESLLASYPNQTVALNATGGNKWMAITAQEVFRFNSYPVFYVDIASGQVLFLDSDTPPHMISATIKLDNYLKSYGYEIQKEKTTVKGLTSEQRELCQVLVKNVTEWGKALGALNKLASDAEASKSLTINIGDLRATSQLDSLLKECEWAGILKYNTQNQTLTFTDDDARFFANGGWLEEFINSRLNELKGEGVLQDSSHLNLKIGNDSTSNEIDVAFMAKNRLHLIECKTKRLTGKHAGSAGTESVYKLDSISDLGGLATKSMLVSYRSLGQADLSRAKDLRIKVVQSSEIQQIKYIIKDWISR